MTPKVNIPQPQAPAHIGGRRLKMWSSVKTKAKLDVGYEKALFCWNNFIF